MPINYFAIYLASITAMASLSIRNVIYALLVPVIYEFTEFIPQAVSSFSRSVYNCYSSEGWTNDTLGGVFEAACVPQDALSCCPPETPEDIQARFILIRQNGDEIDVSFDDRFLEEFTANRFAIVAHGWINDYHVEPYINRTVFGWIKRGADVILIDWSKGNKFLEASAANTRTVGALTGLFVQYFGIASRTTCVGFSHGAHICGFAGQFLKANGEVLSECHGIDPGGPLFVGASSDFRLTRNDCFVVSVIHSSSVIGGTGVGLNEKSGNCDFIFNDAETRTQPGCPELVGPTALLRAFLLLDLTGLLTALESLIYCSHIRGIEYYNRQLWNESNYWGRPCLKNAMNGDHDCVDARLNHAMTIPPDSDCASTDNINVYVYTNLKDWRVVANRTTSPIN